MFGKDNVFSLLSILEGGTQNPVPLVVYLHKSKAAAVGHLEILSFHIIVLESNAISILFLAN